MDVSAAKTKAIVDAAAGSKPKSTAEQLMGDFSAAVAERMKMSGQGVAEHRKANLAETMSANQAAKPEPKADAQPAEVAPRDDRKPRERAEAPEPNRDDTARPVEVKNDAPRDTQQQDAPRNETAQNDRNDDGASQQKASSDSDQTQTDKVPEQQAQSGDNEEAVDTGEAVAQTATEQTAPGHGEQVVAAVVDMIGKTDTTAVATSQQDGGAKTQQSANTQQLATGPTKPGDEVGDVDLAAQNAQKKATANTGQQQSQANTGQKSDGTHTLNSDAALKQQQAADIAAKVGPDQKLNVNVTVTKQSEQLVSQPTANLSAQAAIADDANTTSQTTPQAATRAAAPGPQTAPSHNLGNQTGQQPGGDAQQQAQQQLQMAQVEATKTVSATDNKAQAAQNASTHAANATVKIGGTEGMSNAPGLTQTAPTQLNHQAAMPQKAAANPHAQHRAAVTEQVNVQITKAIADGLDKISIQLRPAHLGRIDVQLEMASDGRVTAVVTADNKDTLDLLKQDSRELERAMREAGLNMGSGDVSYNLRENGGQAQDGQETAGRGLGSGPLTNEPTLDELLEANTSRPNIISEDRVDITA
ncbi:flagellar hook-length control protein FliK [Magnetovibrio sp.]|uniref:flagellar hook-length control protein FliK n=1 Tax=Magnetovibrio sp. TaxID=2024836 RepID=UPI002F92B94E